MVGSRRTHLTYFSATLNLVLHFFLYHFQHHYVNFLYDDILRIDAFYYSREGAKVC